MPYVICITKRTGEEKLAKLDPVYQWPVWSIR